MVNRDMAIDRGRLRRRTHLRSERLLNVRFPYEFGEADSLKSNHCRQSNRLAERLIAALQSS
jgi:succinylglutamate desuccinylase